MICVQNWLLQRQVKRCIAQFLVTSTHTLAPIVYPRTHFHQKERLKPKKVVSVRWHKSSSDLINTLATTRKRSSSITGACFFGTRFGKWNPAGWLYSLPFAALPIPAGSSVQLSQPGARMPFWVDSELPVCRLLFVCNVGLPTIRAPGRKIRYGLSKGGLAIPARFVWQSRQNGK